MTDRELARYCERHAGCDGICTKCAAYQRYKVTNDYDMYCLQQEIMETLCDDIGF